MSVIAENLPLWQRALLARAKDRFGHHNCSASARIDLARRLRDAGAEVSLVTIGTWTRAEQGRAYLWALGWIDGLHEWPPPGFVATASERYAAERPR